MFTLCLYMRLDYPAHGLSIINSLLYGSCFILCPVLCTQTKKIRVSYSRLCPFLHLKVLSIPYILHLISLVLKDFTRHSQVLFIWVDLTSTSILLKTMKVPPQQRDVTKYMIGLKAVLLNVFSQFDLSYWL